TAPGAGGKQSGPVPATDAASGAAAGAPVSPPSPPHGEAGSAGPPLEPCAPADGCQGPAHSTPVCERGSCDFVCTDGWTRCGAACVDAATDVENCGACAAECGSPPN